MVYKKYKSNKSILKLIIESIKKNGLIYTFFNSFSAFYYLILKPKKSFLFNQKKYLYFYHKYNTTFSNERCIEIPLIMDFIKRNSNKRILEVGNVLSHYYPLRWDVIDKYEKARGVFNIDVVGYKPSHKYDLIVSISTLEHIGYDEKTKDSHKIIKVIKNLKKNCLKKRGKILLTVPLGYNKRMDYLIFNKKLKFDKEYFFKKISKSTWKQTNKEQVLKIKYDHPFKGANVILIGIINK